MGVQPTPKVKMKIRGFVLSVILLPGLAPTAQSQSVDRPGTSGLATTTRPFSLKFLRSQCPEFTEVKRGDKPEDARDCRVSEFGEFGTVDGQTYYYALYCLIPNYSKEGKCDDESFAARYHRQRGLAVFVRNESSPDASLLFERVHGDIGILYYERPHIIRTSVGTLLYLPIVVDGTGHFNGSEYFVWARGVWEPVDAEAWLKDLGPRIPKGLGIWKGVWPDLKTMTAEAGLYRERDANCCPSGGTVRIRLAIRARRFVITSVVVEKAR